MASGLPQDCLPPLLELLDADGLAMLRSALNLRDLDGEAHAALLRAVVLELLLATKFPFTHAAYVMGLNGTYYSLDTIAEKHYGIPRALPTLLCALFRHMVPNVPFTTIRIQKFAAATNLVVGTKRLLSAFIRILNTRKPMRKKLTIPWNRFTMTRHQQKV